jgi:hypothetical protein
MVLTGREFNVTADQVKLLEELSKLKIVLFMQSCEWCKITGLAV